MKRFRDLSFRQKLALVTTLTSTLALILACAAFIAYEFISIRSTMVRDLSTSAEMLARNCTAAVAFNDARSAEEILSALSANPNVVAAFIYNPRGEVFAAY